MNAMEQRTIKIKILINNYERDEISEYSLGRNSRTTICFLRMIRNTLYRHDKMKSYTNLKYTI